MHSLIAPGPLYGAHSPCVIQLCSLSNFQSMQSIRIVQCSCKWCCFRCFCHLGAGIQLIPNRKNWIGWKNSAKFFWTFTHGTEHQQLKERVVSPTHVAVGVWGRASCNIKPPGGAFVRWKMFEVGRFDFLLLFSFLIWIEALEFFCI